MSSRLLAIVLIALGLVVTAVGIGTRLSGDGDDGPHPGYVSSFARDSAIGVDELVVAPLGGNEVQVSVLRAGQLLLELDEVDGAPLHVFAVRDDLTGFVHVDPPDVIGTGVAAVELPGPGRYRVVALYAPPDGPELLELGADVVVDGPPVGADGGDPPPATDDVWTDGELTIERQGFDFVLSEPWTGEEYHEGAALVALFAADDLAFTHGHAELVDGDRFRFLLDLPGRGEYLAVLQFIQDGELVTASFRLVV